MSNPYPDQSQGGSQGMPQGQWNQVTPPIPPNGAPGQPTQQLPPQGDSPLDGYHPVTVTSNGYQFGQAPFDQTPNQFGQTQFSQGANQGYLVTNNGGANRRNVKFLLFTVVIAVILIAGTTFVMVSNSIQSQKDQMTNPGNQAQHQVVAQPTSSQQPETQQSTPQSSTAQSSPSPTETDGIIEGSAAPSNLYKIENIQLKFGYKDTADKPAVILSYDFTNQSAREANGWDTQIEPYQGKDELFRALLDPNPPGYHEGSEDRQIKPGQKIHVTQVYTLKNSKEPIVIKAQLNNDGKVFVLKTFKI